MLLTATLSSPLTPPRPVAADRLPPGLSIVSPLVNAHLGASQQVVVRLGDNVGVTHAAYYVDGQLVRTRAGQRMTQDRWQWGGIRPGTHHLQVRAYDAAGNWRSRTIPVIR